MSAIRAVPPGIHDDVTAPRPVHRCAAEFIEGQPSLEADFLSCNDEFRRLRGIGLPLAVPESEVLQRQLQCISRGLSTRPAIAQGDPGTLNAQFGQESDPCQGAVQVDFPVVAVQGRIRDEDQFYGVPQAVPLGAAVGQAYRFLRVGAIGGFGRQSELIQSHKAAHDPRLVHVALGEHRSVSIECQSQVGILMRCDQNDALARIAGQQLLQCTARIHRVAQSLGNGVFQCIQASAPEFP